MVMDGRDYQDAELGYPSLYNPHAPLVGPALSRVLKMAYCVARNHGRTIIDQHDAIDFRSPAASLLRMAMNVSTFARIAEGFRYIPDLATHLVGEAIFSILATGDNVKVYHQLVVVGDAIDFGPQIETEIGVDAAVFSPNNPQGFAAFGLDFSPYGASPAVHRVRFEVELDEAPAGAVREVYVQAWAKEAESGTSVPYFRHHVGVWTEIRG